MSEKRSCATSSAASTSTPPTAAGWTWSTRAPGRSSAPRPSPGAEDVDRAYAAAVERVRDLAGRDAGRAPARPAALRRRGRGARRRAGRAGEPEHRQAAGPDGVGGDPADGRPDPVLRRRRPHAGGQGRRRVHGRAHLLDPAGADRRRRAGDALELPDDDGGLEDRPGDRRGQHRRPQAQRHHAGDDAAAGRAGRRHPAAGRAQRRLRRPGHRPRPGRAPDPAAGRDHRLGAGRACRSPRPPPATSSGCTWSWAARRRWWSSTTPTSRPPSTAIAAAGYFNAGQDCTAATRVLAAPAHPRRLRRRADRAGEEDHHDVRQRRRRRGRPGAAGEQRRPAGPRDRLPRPRPEPRRDHGRRRPAGRPRLLRRADRRRRPAPGRRDGPARGLRPGHHRAALHRRGRGGPLGQRRRARAGAAASGRRTSAGRCG